MREGAGPVQDVTDDALLDGRVRLLQPRRGHRAGTDAVLLAALADAQPGERVVDLGSASGAVGLMVAIRVAGVRVDLLDRQADLVALARENIDRNGLGERVRAVAFDAFAPSGYALGEADLVVTNPPWFAATGRGSPDAGRRAAHIFAGGDLAGWCDTAYALLKPRGRVSLIHRAEALADVLGGLGGRFGTIVVQPVQPRPGKDANRIVVSAVKGSRAPLRLAPALVVHDLSGAFTPDIARFHRGGALGTSDHPGESRDPDGQDAGCRPSPTGADGG